MCKELTVPLSVALYLGNTARFEKMSQRWRAVGNTVSDLTSPRLEPQTSSSIDKRVTAQPTVENICWRTNIERNKTHH